MYILEGTIGAGKSTFLKLLKHHIPAINIKLEPIDTWQSQNYGQSLLAHFYENPKRWAYTFETFTMFYRAQEHILENTSRTPTVFERSIYSGHYVFARNSFEQGFMSALEWDIYQQWFNFLISRCALPQGFIYLKVDPDIAFERIKKRNRQAETTLPLDYLYQIDTQHEKFLCKNEDILPALKKIPVLILDCNQEFEQDSDQFKEHCRSVQTFLTLTQCEMHNKTEFKETII
jgi:deoxyadenosine/deoxycytidine kinase